MPYLALQEGDTLEVWLNEPPPWQAQRVWRHREGERLFADYHGTHGDQDPVYLYGRIELSWAVLARYRAGQMSLSQLIDFIQAEAEYLAGQVVDWCEAWEQAHNDQMLEPFQWGWMDRDGARWYRPENQGTWQAVWFLYANPVPFHLPTYTQRPLIEERMAADLYQLLGEVARLR